MSLWRVDTGRWPIAVFWVGEGATEADVDAFILAADEVLARGEPYVAILDASELQRASPYARQRAVEWQKAHRAELAAHCLGTAFVLSSPLMRFITMTVLLLTDLPTPWRVCANVDAAIAWGQELLSKRRGAGSNPGSRSAS